MEQSGSLRIKQLLTQIDNCDLNDESVKVLSKCEWKYLKQLSLNANDIADGSIDSLSFTDWSQLDKISSHQNGIIFGDICLLTQFGLLNLSKLTVLTVEMNYDLKETASKILKQIKTIK